MMGEIEHGKYEELLDRALDGEITPEERADLDAHLATCEECSEVLEIIRMTSSSWKEQPDVELDPGHGSEIGDRLMERIVDDGSVRARPRASSSGKALYALAAVAVAAAAALILVLYTDIGREDSRRSSPVAVEDGTTDRVRPDDESVPSPAPAVPGKEIPAAMTVKVSGSSVLSRPGQKPVPVSLDTRFEVGDVISLDGDASLLLSISSVASLHLEKGAVMELVEADDDVTLQLRRGVLACHVSKRADGEEFTVVTPGGDVEVTGTVFEVEVMATAEVSVAVAEGNVVARDAADERNVVSVKRGERMDFDWSAPETERLDGRETRRLLARFGMAPADARGGRKRCEDLFKQALEMRGSGDLDGAAATYEKIAASAGKAQRAEAIFSLGQLSYQRGAHGDSIKRLTENAGIFEGTPYETMALFYVAKSSFKLGRCDQTVEAADRFLALSPSHRLAESLRSLKNECSSR